MNFQHNQSKYSYDNSNPIASVNVPQQIPGLPTPIGLNMAGNMPQGIPQIQIPAYQQLYYTQQQSVYGYDQQQYPLQYNGQLGYYQQPQIPMYTIPQYPTPVDSLSSKSNLSVKKSKRKKRIKRSKIGRINERRSEKVSSSSSGVSSSSSSSSNSRSRSRVKRKQVPPHLQNDDNWKCKYCNNINFPHRQQCNRCKKEREKPHKAKQVQTQEDRMKKYQPNPDDWKCNLCGNFNYARRDKCNRCKEDKSKATIPESLGQPGGI